MKGKILAVVAFIACMGLLGYVVAEQGDFSTLGFDTPNGYSFWRVDSSGYLKPGVASTLDIGTSALPVRNIYVGAVVGTGALTATSGTFSTTVGITGATSLSSATVTDAFVIGSRTQAQIEAITPVVGQMYICTDCTATTICISSAAAVMSWIGLESFDVACD